MLGSIYDTPQWDKLPEEVGDGYNVLYNNTKYANITGKADNKTGEWKYVDGYKCETEGPQLFELIALCDPTGQKDVVEFTLDPTSSPCHIKYTSTSRSGCRTDMLEQIEPVLKFSGFILIVLGLALVFFGAKLFAWLLGGQIFLSIFVVFISLIHAFGMLDPHALGEAYSKGENTSLGMVFVVGIIGLIASGVGAFYLTKLLDRYLISITAGVCGGLVSFMVLSPMKLPTAATIVFSLAVGGVTAYFADYVHKYIKTVGTALIGAFMFVRGIGTFEVFGKYPSIFNKVTEGKDLDNVGTENLTSSALGYLACMIFFTCAGSYV